MRRKSNTPPLQIDVESNYELETIFQRDQLQQTTHSFLVAQTQAWRFHHTGNTHAQVQYSWCNQFVPVVLSRGARLPRGSKYISRGTVDLTGCTACKVRSTNLPINTFVFTNI